MYDVKPQVLALLDTIPDVTVTAQYPQSFANLPHISFYEVGNDENVTAYPGLLTEVSIQVDIWHERSTGSLAQQADELLNSIGFRRQMAMDMADPSGVNHKIMRYRGIIDTRSLRVSQ